MSSGQDSTQRFSERVGDYARHRPGYPEAVLETLQQAGLSPGWVAADVGSGTGISAELLLRSGCAVVGVEPNAGMRAAAELRFAQEPRFRSVAGTAEATSLADRSVDLVLAAQAFHWFDRERARLELRRILRPAGWLAVLWNWRRMDATPFMRAYEGLLQEHGTDYHQVAHQRLEPAVWRAVFRDPPRTFTFPSEQVLDREGLLGRLRSASYFPGAGQPGHLQALQAAEALFSAHRQEGSVRMLYDTELLIGRP